MDHWNKGLKHFESLNSYQSWTGASEFAIAASVQTQSVQQCLILPVCAQREQRLSTWNNTRVRLCVFAVKCRAVWQHRLSRSSHKSKSTLSLKSSECFPDVCLHPTHSSHTESDWGGEEEMSSCGRSVENKGDQDRQKEEDRGKYATKQAFFSQIPALKTSLCVIRGQPCHCSRHRLQNLNINLHCQKHLHDNLKENGVNSVP